MASTFGKYLALLSRNRWKESDLVGTAISPFHSVIYGIQWTDFWSVFGLSLSILNHRQLGEGYTGPTLFGAC